MTNINPDGKFQIKTGQGITQGIAEELGLDKNQCKQISVSIWNQIIAEVDKKGSVTTTRNGQTTQSPNSSNNFLVYTNDLIQISKECWNKIVGWINEALGININKLDDAAQIEQTNEPQNKPQTQAEKEQICQKAYEAILANIDKLDLPDGFDKTNIEAKLTQVYQDHLKDLPETVEIRDMTRSMLCELLEETGLQLKERNNIAIKNLVNVFPDDLVADSGLKLNTVSSNADLQKNIDAARTKAIELLGTLSSKDLEKIGIDSDKRDRLIGYLETIYYDNQETSNTMQQLTVDGKPFISVNEKLSEYDNIANMITMLLHEANHCDREFLDRKVGNSKEEERECERIGCMTTALLISRGQLPPTQNEDYIRDYGENYERYGRYEHTFADYVANPATLEKDINKWASGYTNYIDNDTCAVTLEHNDKSQGNNKIEIKPNDIVRIGTRELIIGRDCVLDGMNSQPIFQIRCFNGNEGASNIVFDDLKPSQLEKENCGREELNEDNHKERIVVVRKQSDGSEEKICTGYICGTIS